MLIKIPTSGKSRKGEYFVNPVFEFPILNAPARKGEVHIVFGQASSSMPARLELFARTYFSEVGRDLTGMLNSGQQFSEFKSYVEKYIQFKKAPKGGSGTGVTMEDFTLVAGMNADNEVVECLSFSEFQRQLGLELQQERYLSRGFDGLSLDICGLTLRCRRRSAYWQRVPELRH